MGGKYRVVEIPILQSPCRKCTENICNQSDCSMLVAFNKRCDREAIHYGVCDLSEENSSPLESSHYEEKETEIVNTAPAAKVVSSAPDPGLAPESGNSFFPADMTLDQFFPPARMAQLGKPVQLSLFN